MRAEEATLRVLAELKAQAGRRRGEMTEIEVGTLHRHRGYVSKVYSGERRCGPEELLEILDAMEIDAATHFGRAFGVLADPVGLLERLEAPQTKQPRPLAVYRLRTLRRKARNRGTAESTAPAQPPAVSLERLQDEPLGRQLGLLEAEVELRKPAFVELFLDHLEELRHRRPEDAAQLCEVIASRLPGSEVAATEAWQRLYCRALGIFGSASRQLGRLRAANQALHEALFCAELWKQRREEAGLLQRVCYLLEDYGELTEALRVTELASQAYGDSRHLLGMVKVFVDRGHFLCKLGRAQEASRFFAEALDHLPANERRCRAAAYLGAAEAAQTLGRFAQAEEALVQARALIDTAEPAAMVGFLYREAELALARGDLPRATGVYRQVRQLVVVGSAYDSALGSLALCKALLDLGEEAEARVIAAEMVALLIPLEQERLSAAAVLSELIKAARTGVLSAELVDEARSKIQRAGPALAEPAPLASTVSRSVQRDQQRQHADGRLVPEHPRDPPSVGRSVPGHRQDPRSVGRSAPEHPRDPPSAPRSARLEARVRPRSGETK